MGSPFVWPEPSIAGPARRLACGVVRGFGFWGAERADRLRGRRYAFELVVFWAERNADLRLNSFRRATHSSGDEAGRGFVSKGSAKNVLN